MKKKNFSTIRLSSVVKQCMLGKLPKRHQAPNNLAPPPFGAHVLKKTALGAKIFILFQM